MRTFIIIALAISVASCGKSKRLEKTDEARSRAQGSTEIVETIVKTEKADTLVTLPVIEREVVVDIDPSKDTSFLAVDTPEQSVAITYDPIARKIRTKAVVKERQVPIKIERTEVVQRHIESDYKSDQRSKTTHEETAKTNPLIPWYGWLVPLVLVLAGIYLRQRWKALTG